jgi:hypothetical protein
MSSPPFILDIDHARGERDLYALLAQSLKNSLAQLMLRHKLIVKRLGSDY